MEAPFLTVPKNNFPKGLPKWAKKWEAPSDMLFAEYDLDDGSVDFENYWVMYHNTPDQSELGTMVKVVKLYQANQRRSTARINPQPDAKRPRVGNPDDNASARMLEAPISDAASSADSDQTSKSVKSVKRPLLRTQSDEDAEDDGVSVFKELREKIELAAAEDKICSDNDAKSDTVRFWVNQVSHIDIRLLW